LRLNHAAPPESATRRLFPISPPRADLCHPQLFLSRAKLHGGKGFLCIGDSHRFIDPIFACGVYFGIKEGEFAAEVIARYLSGEVKSNGNPFADFERLCDEGQNVIEDVIGVLWEYPFAFQRIVTWRDKVDTLDLLAGRIYGEEGAKNPARVAMRRLMATKEREREEASAAKAMAKAESWGSAPAG
jgi:flavin-dependent dehydrogenase